MTGVVLGVVGGCGGVGASSFAAELAAVSGPAVLVDLDPMSGGLDVLLGIEAVPGARWSGLRLDGGRLDPALLADGLPRWRGVAVLAADVSPPSPAGVLQLIDAAGELGTVVLDLPRGPSPERDAAVMCCALVVVLVAAGVPGLAAARAVLASLGEVPVGAVVRRGAVPAEEAAERVGAPLLGVLPATGQSRASRVSARVAAGVLDGVLP